MGACAFSADAAAAAERLRALAACDTGGGEKSSAEEGRGVPVPANKDRVGSFRAFCMGVSMASSPSRMARAVSWLLRRRTTRGDCSGCGCCGVGSC